MMPTPPQRHTAATMELTNHTARLASHIQEGAAPLAIDEAFAELSDRLRRIDRPQLASPRQEYAAQCQQLIATIGEQVRAIDVQRSRLVRLLEELEVPSGE